MTLDRRIVGRVPGVISAVPEGFSSAGAGELEGKGYDFAIGSLGFHVANKKETPYQRETVPFRKEQFDAAQVVGEQSLDGFWLRSQRSWHHGAGIKFYEVLDGDTVLNRYKTSLGMNPWTAGEVALTDSFSAAAGSLIIDAVPGTHSGSKGVFELLSDGSVEHRQANGTTTAYTEGGTAVSITTDGTSLYAAVGNIIKVQDGTTTLATLITHGDAGKTWQGIWWAKGRLFCVDSDDNWFALAPVTATPTIAADAFWTPGATSGTWCLTETPAFVLMGIGTQIHAVTITSTGAVPTLDAPRVVAEVPVGETIATLHHYLGSVAICTQRGLRIGQADSSDSTPVVVYGPMLIEGDFSGCRRMASRGSLMFAIGDHVDYEASTLFAINLEQVVSDLRPAWAAHIELDAAATSMQGSVVDADGLLWAWANNQVRVEDSTLAASGDLTTGQLRFGTLESKLFNTIHVEGEGDGGTIAISSVQADGEVSSLYTMDLAVDKEIDLTVSLSAPIKSLGFQFILASKVGDASVRPKLLGYQVRALPAPQRQRLIRVPLLIHDKERNRRKVNRGRVGGAWDRLNALEQLEESQVLVQYRDFRTGEAGTAQIERVTFQGETPPDKAADNFGGLAYVELRVL